MRRTAFFIVLGALAVVGLIYILFEGAPLQERPGARMVHIDQKWELPEILEEVSGITFLNDFQMACIQDEEGIIFIYNLNTSSIEKEITFAGIGDYEGIAVAGSTAYVLRSDGVLFEVENYMQEFRKTNEHDLGMNAGYDFEGLCYDASNNRLLLAIKDIAGEDFKPVFAFDLASKEIVKEPVYKIHFGDPVFEVLEKKRSHRIFRPSEIEIHPRSGNIYLLEGVNPKLLILDSTGRAQQLHVLKKEQFTQPEGIAFNSNGDLFISNEGGNQPANILKISLNK